MGLQPSMRVSIFVYESYGRYHMYLNCDYLVYVCSAQVSEVKKRSQKHMVVLIGEGCKCRDMIGREFLEQLSRDEQIPQETPRNAVRIRRITGVNQVNS